MRVEEACLTDLTQRGGRRRNRDVEKATFEGRKEGSGR
jgi:hypothetical protein